MQQPLLTPCCNQDVRWDGELWYCNQCNKTFIPARPCFEKPFAKKPENDSNPPASRRPIGLRIKRAKMVFANAVHLVMRF